MFKFIDVNGNNVKSTEKTTLPKLQEFIGGTVTHVGNFYYNPAAMTPNKYKPSLCGNIVEVTK